ncbi:MAG: beta-lactamase family protein [Acidobacteria bacterium]|nr:beta-lactamase family protein [Acidobacteriota bacterium]
MGVASIETGVPITPDTLFSSGVLSKISSHMALVSLADEGRIDLSSPVGKYVKGLSPKLSRVTAHQLLSQTAGITEEHLPYSLWGDSALGTAVRSWKDDRVFSEPGRIFSSSHQTYDLA